MGTPNYMGVKRRWGLMLDAEEEEEEEEYA
jgi:hypothetical protein